MGLAVLDVPRAYRHLRRGGRSQTCDVVKESRLKVKASLSFMCTPVARLARVLPNQPRGLSSGSRNPKHLQHRVQEVVDGSSESRMCRNKEIGESCSEKQALLANSARSLANTKSAFFSDRRIAAISAEGNCHCLSSASLCGSTHHTFSCASSPSLRCCG